MGHRFADILFSAPVKSVQQAENSRDFYARFESREDSNYRLTDKEIQFLQCRDSFYIASVSPDGWPYIQHRGGAQGFIKIINENHIGFADFSGNRQYITTGNLRANNRVALFFMDYPKRRRLKMLGRAFELNATENIHENTNMRTLVDSAYPAQVERGFVIRVEAFDWNCSQHIIPRYDQMQIDTFVKSTSNKQPQN